MIQVPSRWHRLEHKHHQRRLKGSLALALVEPRKRSVQLKSWVAKKGPVAVWSGPWAPRLNPSRRLLNLHSGKTGVQDNDIHFCCGPPNIAWCGSTNQNIMVLRPMKWFFSLSYENLKLNSYKSYFTILFFREPVKEAMSPSVAESLRATFAAFLWHEGIVHDAMACASFLKFHPTLPKQGAMVVTRHTDRLLNYIDLKFYKVYLD